MKRRAGSFVLGCFLSFITIQVPGQDCTILSKANSILPDKLCSPVTVEWTVSYTGVHDAGTTVEILYQWDDGTSETVTATEINAVTSEWEAVAIHVYTSMDEKCNYKPLATLVVNDDVCESSSQEQIVTVWDDDNHNGGYVYPHPQIYPVCVGNGATVVFLDDSYFNCVPPTENDNPNTGTRWIQWVYGVANNMSGDPVEVDGVVESYPFEGPVIKMPGPITGSDEVSLPITVGDNNQIGEEFMVHLRYWNYCNPYEPDPPAPYVYTQAVIRIVGNPDATITPVDTLCESNPVITLSAATSGGTWSGSGIVDANLGRFDAFVAGPGTHEIRYDVTDGNSCSGWDTVLIVVSDAPDASITPVDPLCISDAIITLQAAAPQGTWSGNGIINPATGLFDPSVAGVGTHAIAFTSEPDGNGCFGTDTIDVQVVDLPFAEFLTPDSSWCEQANNQSTAEILITGTGGASFDLVINSQGTRDTIPVTGPGIMEIQLDNQVGINEYSLVKIIEHHGANSCERSLIDALVMQVNPNPVMSLDVNYKNLCSPVEVQFTAPVGFNKYNWFFGDGQSDQGNLNTISHTYTFSYKDNPYSIVDEDTVYQLVKHDTLYRFSLQAETHDGCQGTVVDSIRIYPRPDANFFVSPVLQYYPDSIVYLINLTSLGVWDYLWDYGDMNQDTVKEPYVHIYDSWGFYTITLVAYSDHCLDSITKKIQIMPPPPQAGFEPDTTGCPPLSINFHNNSLYAETYIWDFDDGHFSSDANPTHVFFDSREHTVRLAAFGLSGSDTTEQTVLVYERPQAIFDVYPKESRNLKQTFKFTNQTINGSYYLWDFGDGTTSPVEEPSHIYEDSGTFDITLYAWNDQDCSDTLQKGSLITVRAGEGSIDFPTVFVWNGAGPSGGHWEEGKINNNVFHPAVINAKTYRMEVYTRWGQRIFTSDDLYIGWDGYMEDGTLATEGVYLWKAWVKYVDGSEDILVGDITFLH